jgi:hypothetical protein
LVVYSSVGRAIDYVHSDNTFVGVHPANLI